MPKFRALLLAAMLSCAAHAWAEEAAIGYVKTVAGEANLLVAGKAQKAEAGTPVRLGNVLKTGKEGAMGVAFLDNTIMSLGPDTEISVDEYVYAPGTGALKLVAAIGRGTLNYISGVIAKLKPEAVTIKTPTGTIGIRGTHFLVKVEAEE